MDPVDRPGFAERREKILAAFRVPAPHAALPPEIRRAARDPVARFLMLLGGLLGGLVLVGAVAGAVVLDNAFLPLFHLVFLLPLGGLCLYGRLRQRKVDRLLESGEIVKGRVRRVERAIRHVGRQALVVVDVEVVAADGRRIASGCWVDCSLSEYFKEARDLDREVDVLYHPDAGSTVLLVDRVALALLFD